MPFEGIEHPASGRMTETALLNAVPDDFRDVIGNNPHLLEYLLRLRLDELGIPKYLNKISRNLGDDKKPNYIYPSNDEGVFVHILFNTTDSRHSYIPIEPSSTRDFMPLVRSVEHKLLELRSELSNVVTSDNRQEQLLEWIFSVTTSPGRQELPNRNPGIRSRRRKATGFKKLALTRQEMDGLRYLYMRDKYGLGALQPLIADPNIEDISCSGLGHVFIEHKVFKALKSALVFEDIDDLDQFVLWLAERIKKPITFRNPISDATLPDGSRINMVFGKNISKRGSNFTIRKFAGVPTSIFELVDFGSINYLMLAYLSLAIGNGMNVFVSGETASGKTTLLNAVTAFIHPLAKVVTIEDTPELQVPHKNWIREVVQTTKTDDKSNAVNMFDLLRAALRQRPNQIIVGEIRGPEGNVAFQAMQTGHAVMATFHAASVEKLIQRITGNPISVPKTYVDNLNIVLLTSMVKLPNGKMGRRVLGINEIVSYDSSFDAFTFIEVFHWNEINDTFEFPGYMTSEILENRIAPKFGVANRNKHWIYSELNRRAKILEKLHKEQGITDFYAILDVLSKAQREGLF
ncbi:Flagella-related protein FlaI [Dehalogenimonas sp. WBC-2]|nr:Flagella-related protein FlaI [Dehalogenimonas sp. WBC-2]